MKRLSSHKRALESIGSSCPWPIGYERLHWSCDRAAGVAGGFQRFEPIAVRLLEESPQLKLEVTLAQIAGALIQTDVNAQVEGRDAGGIQSSNGFRSKTIPLDRRQRAYRYLPKIGDERK